MANFITKTGLAELQAQYDEIINVKIPEVLMGLNDALAAGDLSENSARDVLLVEQQRLNAEKQRIELILNDYELIDENALTTADGAKTVRIGKTVKVNFPDEDKTMTLKIMGTSEADILDNPPRIGNDSPLALAMLGKKVGDEVVYRVKQTRMRAVIEDIVD